MNALILGGFARWIQYIKPGSQVTQIRNTGKKLGMQAQISASDHCLAMMLCPLTSNKDSSLLCCTIAVQQQCKATMSKQAHMMNASTVYFVPDLPETKHRVGL